MAREGWLELSAGRFRALTWGADDGETVLFLHGLTAVAEVWGPAISHLRPDRRYVAIDQRGHGDSPRPGAYRIGDFLRDTREAIAALGPPVHLVGHSMGARVAIVVASRLPHLLRTVAVVDIGVEASIENIRDTARGIGNMPKRFADESEAFAFAFRNRTPDDDAKAVFRARLKQADGGLEWRGSPDAMIETVRSHRARNYWRDWRSVRVPALFVHGGRSNEVSRTVAARMREANPAIQYQPFEDTPHNIPLIAPARLAESLERLWTTTAPPMRDSAP